jgi:ABC-2 type transport system ATP-binding protein
MTVSLDRVTIRYGNHTAVEDLSVTFERGAVGLLGRNGAGKSSVLKAMLGLVRPHSGSMRFLDLPADASPAAIRAHVGYMPERDAHLPQCTGFEMVSLLGMLSGMPRRDAWRRAHEVLYLVGLDEQRYRPVAGYSTGMKQKAKLAAALVHDPQVLFLDEPTNGLDPAGRADMLDLVRQLSHDLGKSVLFSTHILQDVEVVCDAAVVLERGRVVAQGALRDLTRGGERQHTLGIEPATPAVAAALARLGRVQVDGNNRYTLWLPAAADSSQVFAAVAGCGAAVRSFVPHRRSLEDVFLQAIAVPSASSVNPPAGPIQTAPLPGAASGGGA